MTVLEALDKHGSVARVLKSKKVPLVTKISTIVYSDTIDTKESGYEADSIAINEAQKEFKKLNEH